MYINLDVVMRLVQIGLVIAGIGALITLAMFFKNLIGTLHALTGTLDLLQKDLAKLEGPLNTVDELSSTVSDIQNSAKRAANTAIDTFQASSAHLMQWIDSKTPLTREKLENQAPKPDFEPVKEEKPAPQEKKEEPASPTEPAAPQETVQEPEEIVEVIETESEVSQLPPVPEEASHEDSKNS